MIATIYVGPIMPRNTCTRSEEGRQSPPRERELIRSSKVTSSARRRRRRFFSAAVVQVTTTDVSGYLECGNGPKTRIDCSEHIPAMLFFFFTENSNSEYRRGKIRSLWPLASHHTPPQHTHNFHSTAKPPSAPDPLPGIFSPTPLLDLLDPVSCPRVVLGECAVTGRLSCRG